jgi:hypothetical protein
MTTFKIVMSGIGALIVLTALVLGGRYATMKIEGWFAPREQNIQRAIFEETKSFNEAKEQELVKYRFEHMKGDEVTKKAIEATVRHSFADYDEDKFSPELRDFVRQCKGF